MSERFVCNQRNQDTRERKHFNLLNIAKFHIASEVTDSLVNEESIGNMTYDCSYCNATFWEGEKLSTSTKLNSKFSLCCGEGRVVLPPLNKLPELLDHLFTSTNTRGRDFRNQTIKY